jgi:hypothetical protein
MDPGFSSIYNLSVLVMGFFSDGGDGKVWLELRELQIVTYCSIQHNDNND